MSIADKLTQIAENEQAVFDAGKKSEYDTFWDSYQENGNKVAYRLAFFGSGWNDTTFHPKYPIKMYKGQQQMQAFYYFRGTHIDVDIDLSLIHICAGLHVRRGAGDGECAESGVGR